MADILAPYQGTAQETPVAKLSISLPHALLDAVRETAENLETSVSAIIAASLRRTLDDLEQVRIDQALDDDAEENLAWARATAPGHAELMSKLEW
jgi:hypothetical protein